MAVRPGPADPGRQAGHGRALVRNRKKAAPASGTKVAAADLVALLAAAFPGGAINVVADAAYRRRVLRHLPPSVIWTCRLPANAVLYDLGPGGPGAQGRPLRKADRLGVPGQLAAAARWSPAWAYGRDQDIVLANITCLWYGCLGSPAPSGSSSPATATPTCSP